LVFNHETFEDFADLTRSAKKALADIFGDTVAGSRSRNPARVARWHPGL
jgi:hypothetical protein